MSCSSLELNYLQLQSEFLKVKAERKGEIIDLKRLEEAVSELKNTLKQSKDDYEGLKSIANVKSDRLTAMKTLRQRSISNPDLESYSASKLSASVNKNDNVSITPLEYLTPKNNLPTIEVNSNQKYNEFNQSYHSRSRNIKENNSLNFHYMPQRPITAEGFYRQPHIQQNSNNHNNNNKTRIIRPEKILKSNSNKINANPSYMNANRIETLKAPKIYKCASDTPINSLNKHQKHSVPMLFRPKININSRLRNSSVPSIESTKYSDNSMLKPNMISKVYSCENNREKLAQSKQTNDNSPKYLSPPKLCRCGTDTPITNSNNKPLINNIKNLRGAPMKIEAGERKDARSNSIIRSGKEFGIISIEAKLQVQKVKLQELKSNYEKNQFNLTNAKRNEIIGDCKHLMKILNELNNKLGKLEAEIASNKPNYITDMNAVKSDMKKVHDEANQFLHLVMK